MRIWRTRSMASSSEATGSESSPAPARHWRVRAL
ncbi:Uncharacterised protein [Bordetella pertussis]|nr:Uncharacterised protein [Bordetella pertussis]